MRKLLYIVPLLFLSCSAFQKENSDKKKMSKSKSITSLQTLVVEIGAIGSFQSNLISKEFQTNAFPVLNQKIRVSAVVKSFDKSTLKQLKKVQHLDSSSTPKKYVILNVIDKVSLIEELNDSHNKKVQSFLKNVEESFLVTSVSSIFTKEVIEKISNTEEVYLKSNSNNDFVLELYKNEHLSETIHLSKGKTFTYKTSGFCWSENKKHEIIITNITSSKCSKNSYKTYNKAVKKKVEFKF